MSAASPLSSPVRFATSRPWTARVSFRQTSASPGSPRPYPPNGSRGYLSGSKTRAKSNHRDVGVTDAMSDTMSYVERIATAQAVVWDVDGTLADSTALGFTSTNVVLKLNEIPTITLEQYKFATRYPTPQRMAFHAVGNTDDPIGEKLGSEFDKHYVELVSTKTTGFYEGIPVLIEALGCGNKKQAVLSNACGDYARRVVEVNQYGNSFDTVHGADDAPEPKPSPAGLLQIAKSNGWNPVRCIYVGDSPSDGAAAMSAGMVSVGCAWGAHDVASLTESKNFHVIANTVGELRKVLLSE